MKKIVFLFCLVFIIGAANKAHAQVQVALGLKGGLNLAKVDDSGLDNKTGIHAGVFALIKATKIGVQPEIIFSRQGFKQTSSFGDLKTEIDYINIPIIVKLYLAAGLNLQVGPQFGLVSKAKQQIPTVGSLASQDIKDLVKGTDVSLALGLGWDLPFGLTIDGRYNLGLTKVNETSLTSSDIKNQVIQISVGYKILKFGK